MQAVLLLLGGADTPASVPSSEFLLQQNAGVYNVLLTLCFMKMYLVDLYVSV